MKKSLIIGRHPAKADIESQMAAMGYEVTTTEGYDLAAADGTLLDPNDFSLMCILSDYEVPAADADNQAMTLVGRIAKMYDATSHGGRRLEVQLVLRNQTTLWMIQNVDLRSDLNERLDVYPFTMEDQWAKTVLTGSRREGNHCYPLDRRPIDRDSNQTVHLVVIGNGALAESLAITAALVAHYPNYVRDNSLRSRITIVSPDTDHAWSNFRQRQKALFDNSYWRTIPLEGSATQPFFHRPMYSGTRDDFVDIDWEFALGTADDPLLRQKLDMWAQDPRQQLTIALCSKDEERNYDLAFTLPDAVYDKKVPVLVAMSKAEVMETVSLSNSMYSEVHPIGMANKGHDVGMPVMQMAKRLNYFYSCSFGGKGVPTSMPKDEIEEKWTQQTSVAMRFSNIYNAMTLPTKMRSLGHDEGEWDKFYALTQNEIRQTAAVEHNRWSVERLILGFRPPTDGERKEIEENIEQLAAARRRGEKLELNDLKNAYKKRKIHYDLCSYAELGIDKTGQDVRIYDYDLTACIPLIANSYHEDGQERA